MLLHAYPFELSYSTTQGVICLPLSAPWNINGNEPIQRKLSVLSNVDTKKLSLALNREYFDICCPGYFFCIVCMA